MIESTYIQIICVGTQEEVIMPEWKDLKVLQLSHILDTYPNHINQRCRPIKPIQEAIFT